MGDVVDLPLEPGDNRARREDPGTAHVAAAISSKRKGTADRAILEYLRDTPRGGTTLEISEAIHRKHNNISSRFVRLEEVKLIHRTGDKRRNALTRCESEIWYYGPKRPAEPEQAAMPF